MRKPRGAFDGIPRHRNGFCICKKQNPIGWNEVEPILETPTVSVVRVTCDYCPTTWKRMLFGRDA